MKVFVAHFTSENNEHIEHTVNIDEFHLKYGEDCLDAIGVRDIFENSNIEMIPSIYADINPNGMIEKEAFDIISEKILSKLIDNINEIDALYLQFHGASGILDLDCVSGEHYLINEIRKITGKYMPIAMVMDPHGNLTKQMGEQINILRCYRESPHSDALETNRHVATLLVDLMNNKRHIEPVVKKMPIMIGGERSVSAKEPVKSINKMLDEAEHDDRIMSASFHVGYIRHDDDKLGVCVVVVPSELKFKDHCNEVADKICNFIWLKRKEFKFTSNNAELDESVKEALEYNNGNVVITDSGDNCGAGGSGQNTMVLKELLKYDSNKKILIAGINDQNAHEKLSKCNIGDSVDLSVGMDINDLSSPVDVRATLLVIGKQHHGKAGKKLGKTYTLNINETNIDIIIINHNVQYGTMEQFKSAGLNFHDYDIVVVKMGYLDTYLIPETKHHIMALTNGATIQRSERIPFKKIYRPMWPIDDMEGFDYIE